MCGWWWTYRKGICVHVISRVPCGKVCNQRQKPKCKSLQCCLVLPMKLFVFLLIQRHLKTNINSWELYNQSPGGRALRQPGSDQAMPSLGTGTWKGKIVNVGRFSFIPPSFFSPSCFASPERSRLNVILTLNGRKGGRRWEQRRKIHLLHYCQPLSFPSSLTGPGLKVWLQWPDSTH